MLNRRLMMGGLALGVLASCAPQSRLRSYDGREVTSILVYKERRRMYLLHNTEVLRGYDFELGFAPVGDKQVEGDGKTPEGLYYIDRRNPDSMFHLSLGISYPNARDRADAAALGRSPGGNIFIHGTPNMFMSQDDWTWGCIAVTNREMEEIYAMVRVGTPIYIEP